MGNFNLTITNEGAAFLADVIANQGSLEFTEVRFSSTNYVGSEAALTEGTFGGTFITAVPSASILSQTTIDIAASFDNTTFTIAKQLYSIGVIAEDGDGNTVLVAVCTTSVPDTIPAYMAPGSNYAFNINMTVSSTDHITVIGSVAGVLYVADIVDNLNSYETNKPLSANQGRLLKELIPSSGMFPHMIVISDSGSVVTLTKGAKVITATETSTGHFEADVDEYGTWTIDAVKGYQSGSSSVTVDAVKVYNVTVTFFSATIAVNYPNDMRGETFTCVLDGISFTETAPNNANTFNFSVPSIGTWTVTGAYSKDVVITTDGETQSVTFYTLKTFATATEQEIVDMVSEADAGNIDLYDDAGWRVGQERSVSLSAINSSGTYDSVTWSVGESQAAQTATLVLMHKGLYELVNPVLDKQGQARTTCSFVVGLKNCLSAKGYMNGTATNSGSWNGCARRNWCNGGFRQALPSDLRSCFKKFKCITGDYNNTPSGGTNITSQDYFALPAEKEIFGSNTWSTTNETNALTQFEWYQNTANRIKKQGDSGSACIWSERSPGNYSSSDFCFVLTDGDANGGGAQGANGISPFGCL